LAKLLNKDRALFKAFQIAPFKGLFLFLCHEKCRLTFESRE